MIEASYDGQFHEILTSIQTALIVPNAMKEIPELSIPEDRRTSTPIPIPSSMEPEWLKQYEGMQGNMGNEPQSPEWDDSVRIYFPGMAPHERTLQDILDKIE